MSRLIWALLTRDSVRVYWAFSCFVETDILLIRCLSVRTGFRGSNPCKGWLVIKPLFRIMYFTHKLTEPDMRVFLLWPWRGHLTIMCLSPSGCVWIPKSVQWLQRERWMVNGDDYFMLAQNMVSEYLTPLWHFKAMACWKVLHQRLLFLALWTAFFR